jgi:hypothetical protein
LTIFAGGTGFAAVEDKPSAWDGIWWAVQTGESWPLAEIGRAAVI